MTWTLAVGGDTTFEASGSDAIWDDGATSWDLSENVFITSWDNSLTTYTPTTGGATQWV